MFSITSAKLSQALSFMNMSIFNAPFFYAKTGESKFEAYYVFWLKVIVETNY